MYRAVCIRACTFGGRLWREGERYVGRVKPPHHFRIEEEPAKPAAEGDDPGKKHNQLKSMNKTELKEYGATIGLDLDMELKQAEMIERIQEREREVAEGNGEGVN